MSKISSFGIRQKILLGFVFPLVLVGGFALYIFHAIQSSLDTADWVRHTQEVIAKANLLEKLKIDMETGQRGFLITGKEQFLEPYNSSKQHWDDEINELKALVSDSPVQVNRVEEIERVADVWLRTVATPEIELRRQVSQNNGDLTDITKIIESEKGLELIAEIRERIGKFVDVEKDLMLKREAQARETAEFTLLIASIGLPLLLVIGVALSMMSLFRTILTPLNELRNATNKVAQGDLEIVIESGSNDELGQLATSFNKMTEYLKTTRDEVEVANKELRGTYKALENKAAELASASEHKSQFLANMSHEIRTPLNGVVGMLNLIKRCQLDEKAINYTHLAQESAELLLIVINDILDFSKIEAGKLDIESIDFDIQALFSDFSQAIGHRAQEKGIEFVLDITELAETKVKGDPGRIRQVLNNLVNNAIKFTQQGEIVIRARVEELDYDTLKLHCSIIDTGIGISADKVANLFSAFSQEDASTTRKYGGTGLGLTIVKQLCELMGGDVWVSSLQGRGSDFSFEVLLTKGDAEDTQIPHVEMEGKKILVVDSNRTNREVLVGQLQIWKSTVVEAESGTQAHEILTNSTPNSFDVVILDSQTPGLDGAALGRKIRENEDLKDLKLILMTSMSEKGDAEYFSNLGFNAYFPKPVTPSDLFDALRIVMSDSHLLASAKPLLNQHNLSEFRKSLITEGRVLLVEDNRFNQEVALGMLEEFGVGVGVASNGKEAISELRSASKSTPYSLILMDCQMPEMDGYEATSVIRSGNANVPNPEIPIIAMTANAMRGDREKCLSVGMNDYLSKPVDPDELKSKILEWGNLMELSGVKKEKPAAAPVEEYETVDLEMWDQERFLKRLRGNVVRAKQLVALFLETTRKSIDKLMVAVENKDEVEIVNIAHVIKGSSGNMECKTLFALCYEIEQAGKSGDYDTVHEKVTMLPDVYQDFAKILEKWMSQES